ncbi:MAG TPA: WbqC family protein [Candidatus Dormibacteraeota bacterium]|nr:WbqC family protein [Candidatus Dormibacteraeota bacterium]
MKSNPSIEPPRPGTKRVAILQSSYIPWKGYFDIINLVDEFILYDDRQYTRRDWRNRNLIKTAQGLHWLSIPVQVKGRYHQRIDETLVADSSWPERHWASIEQAYARAAHFDDFRDAIGAAYTGTHETRLSLVNRRFLEVLAGLLGVRTKFSWSTDYDGVGDRTERLVSLCRAAGAREYLSGPSARAYIDQAQFDEAGVRLIYMDYSGYSEYPQLHRQDFVHEVSILDLLFNTGADAPRYMKSFASVPRA